MQYELSPVGQLYFSLLLNKLRMSCVKNRTPSKEPITTCVVWYVFRAHCNYPFSVHTVKSNRLAVNWVSLTFTSQWLKKEHTYIYMMEIVNGKDTSNYAVWIIMHGSLLWGKKNLSSNFYIQSTIHLLYLLNCVNSNYNCSDQSYSSK